MYANYAANITAAAQSRSYLKSVTWSNSQPPAGLTKRLRKHNLQDKIFSEKQRFCNLKGVSSLGPGFRHTLYEQWTQQQ
jgi:hypothetical protein